MTTRVGEKKGMGMGKHTLRHYNNSILYLASCAWYYSIVCIGSTSNP